MHFKRFDQALDSLTLENAWQKHEEWKLNYGYFYRDFVEKILPMGNVHDDSLIVDQLRELAINQNFQDLRNEVQEKYQNLANEEENLTIAMKHLHFHFPEMPLPQQWVSFLSGFEVQSIVGENYIGAGLDMYLGADSKFYPALVPTIPLYISRRFTAENLTPRLIEGYIREEIVAEQDLEANFLSHMIHHGKVLYLMDLALPSVPDSLKIGYTNAQMEWANRFESSLWDWAIQEEKLFDQDYLSFQKHLNEAPFTPELGQGQESAPKIGVFLGWKIVKKYMKKHPETSARDLLMLQDAVEFLKQAQYNGL